MYKAIFYHPEGDYVTDFHETKTIEKVWDNIGNMGSQWIFYPIPFVADNNGVIRSAPDDLEYLEGKTKQEISDLLNSGWEKHAQKMCDILNDGQPVHLIFDLCQ